VSGANRYRLRIGADDTLAWANIVTTFAGFALLPMPDARS
jgi:hypothetical protein